ncbi:hypothetical protein MIND_01133000 [Mycena indigotica]|uniref:F-box domain-containing protein n=1 Tax=Mycena indigotica TaxID=2126181 RepID=A0A8H6S7J5_9AGAR|nr:uncharacterized protein MIND_01133000 [Mycena indigotica]KAF7293546.1 hypothetical protein MIND_01133000 [Mycena indigotica]
MAPCVTSPPTPAMNEALAMVDILGVIFEACLAFDISITWQNDVRQKMALGAVCRCWKLALESIPALWSHIILVPRMPLYYIDKVFWLAKATPKHLSIELDLDSGRDITFLSHIAALLVAKASSVAYLSLQYWSYFVWGAFIRYISALNPRPTFSSLRKFSATPADTSIDSATTLPRPFPGLAQSLEHLHLDGLPPCSFMAGFNIKTLVFRHYNLVSNRVASSAFTPTLLDCFRQLPRLESLAIDVTEPFIAQSPSYHPVVLPRLNYLAFCCDTPYPHACGTLISLLHVPQIRTLALRLASLSNTNDFLSINATRISQVTTLRLIGAISAYIEFTGGRARLLSGLTGNKLRILDFLDASGTLEFDPGRKVLVQTRFLDIIAHALALPTVHHLVVPLLLSPIYPDSHASLIRSLFEPVSIHGKGKHIFENHALCHVSDSVHSNCGRHWTWDYHGLHWERYKS